MGGTNTGRAKTPLTALPPTGLKYGTSMLGVTIGATEASSAPGPTSKEEEPPAGNGFGVTDAPSPPEAGTVGDGMADRTFVPAPSRPAPEPLRSVSFIARGGNTVPWTGTVGTSTRNGAGPTEDRYARDVRACF